MPEQYRFAQFFLLAIGILAVIFLLAEIAIVLAATQPGSTPALVDTVQAGPYQFQVSISKNPAQAGLALPFAISPTGQTSGQWSYQVTSVYRGKLVATPVRDSVSPDQQHPGGITGTAEITVQGPWNLQVMVNGPLGKQTFNVPVNAVTLPPVPIWFGWFLGFIPVYGILTFLVLKRRPYPAV
jgi:hypothetical protein